MVMKEPKLLLGPMRVPFLVLAPVCVLLGVGTAAWRAGAVDGWHVLLAFVAGVAAHISVNALNEYADFRSGLDFQTTKTPFSGGSGTLPERPEMARSALVTGLVAAAITAAIGLYFAAVWGLAILPLGIVGLLVIVIYTNWLTRYALLCLFAPGLGFGLLMVMGTDFALTGEYSWAAFFASLVPFFLVNDLLLLNQFPDAEADATVGRRHLVIAAGKKRSSVVYGLFLLAAFLSIVIGVILSHLPPWSLLGLVALLLAVPVGIGAYRYAEDMEKLMPYLGMNVLLNIVTPVLVAVGLLVG
jgi:1,4-dihydroxy-2-naphthoate octaprenyltransferase